MKNNDKKDNKMFEEIIKVEDGKVSARELHEFLEIGTQFTKWFERMIGYGFDINSDFRLVSQKRKTNNPKNPYTIETDYEITLDMAKELSMIQRTDKGKQARQYFIQCEKFIQDSKLTEEFKYYRQTGKIARHDLTDTIKNKLEPSNHFVYANYTDLVYLKVFGKKAKQLKEERGLKKEDNLRDSFSVEELEKVLKTEEEVKSMIITFNLLGMNKKEIYQKIKETFLK